MTGRTDGWNARRAWLLTPWVAAAALLAIPLVAMQFTSEVQWTASDFVVMGAMLAVAIGGYQLLARRGGSIAYRLGAALAMFAAFFLVWVNLAIGIIGSENNDANMMYAGVLAVTCGGACIAHLQARGMARAMAATAAAQVLVAAIALAGNLGTDGVAWPNDVIGATVIVTTMWLASAALFARAARA